MKYVLADENNFHYAPPFGFILVWLKTDLFIKLTPDLQIDVEDCEYINNLAQHIKDGFPLDGLELGEESYHDGRHRAHAAKQCGIDEVPVFIHPNLQNFIFEIDI